MTATAHGRDPRSEQPGDALLAGEARDAMTAALARLSGQERRDILACYSDGSPAESEVRGSRGALRVRMTRTRAKLRLEYLLAFRHVELPSLAQLVGPLRPLQIRAGDRGHFTGTLIGDPSSYPARAGVHGSDAVLLARRGAHLAVNTTRIRVQH